MSHSFIYITLSAYPPWGLLLTLSPPNSGWLDSIKYCIESLFVDIMNDPPGCQYVVNECQAGEAQDQGWEVVVITPGGGQWLSPLWATLTPQHKVSKALGNHIQVGVFVSLFHQCNVLYMLYSSAIHITVICFTLSSSCILLFLYFLQLLEVQ